MEGGAPPELLLLVPLKAGLQADGEHTSTHMGEPQSASAVGCVPHGCNPHRAHAAHDSPLQALPAGQEALAAGQLKPGQCQVAIGLQIPQVV